MKKTRLIQYDLLRILAFISVYAGHFLGGTANTTLDII